MTGHETIVYDNEVKRLLVLCLVIGLGVLGLGWLSRPKHNPEIWHVGHGDDPTSVNDIFGKLVQEISYPWQTFKLPDTMLLNEALKQIGEEGKRENDVKHEGYMWAVARDLPCDTKGYCVKAFRVQYHFHPTMDMVVRWHSAAMEVQVCKDNRDEKTCGIIRTGGWFDFGYLYTPENSRDCKKQSERVELPVDKQFVLADAETKTDIVDEMRCHAKDGEVQWWGHGGSDARFQLTVKKNKETEMKIAYFLPVNKYYVDGYIKNGIVNMPLGERYINRFGQLVSGCKQAALDCIPIEYSNIYLSGDIEKEVVGFRQVDK